MLPHADMAHLSLGPVTVKIMRSCEGGTCCSITILEDPPEQNAELL